MHLFIIRLLFVVTLLCDFLVAGTSVEAQKITANSKLYCQEQIKQNDAWNMSEVEEPQNPVETAVRSVPSSSRVVCTRSIHLLPTHGGKPNHPHSRLSGELNYHFKKSLQQSRLTCQSIRTIASSPRLYYVIALRRLLC